MALEISPELRDGVASILQRSVHDTLMALFSVDIRCIAVRPEDKKDMDPPVCVCRANLIQDGITVALHFSFATPLLRTLLKDMYPPEMFDDPNTLTDAACEIANIVGCNVKTYLNANGYSLNLDIPFVVDPQPSAEEAVHLHFALNEDQMFVGVSTEPSQPNYQHA